MVATFSSIGNKISH